MQFPYVLSITVILLFLFGGWVALAKAKEGQREKLK